MKVSYLILLFTVSLFSQKNLQLSTKAKISIITCAPGQDELYTAFGHSAFRVQDAINNIDRVYNYGMFDFNTPNFYLKFCQGKLLYEVKSYDFKYFPYQYQRENRWIKAQVLNLNPHQNQQVFNFLEWNILPENKKYHYDFFYDNCATKISEVLEKSIGKVDFDFSSFPKKLTHRNLIHQYLVKNSWSKFGIDLALGAVIDKKATLKQYMFLPDYVYASFKNSTLNNIKTIAQEGFILSDHHLKPSKTNFFLSPLFAALILSAITLYFFLIYKKNKLWFRLITISYGILGVLIFTLWFLTEHSTTKMNMNILWASPLLLVYPFLKNNESKKVFGYIGFISLTGFFIVSLTNFQKFDTATYILTLPLFLTYLKSIKPIDL